MGIAGLSQVPTKEIIITQDACETKDQRRGKAFTNLSSGSTPRPGIFDTACVLSWPNSHWAVHVLDYPNVSSIPLHSWPVLHSWKPVSTCAEWLGPQVLPATPFLSPAFLLNSVSPFSFHPPLPFQPSTASSSGHHHCSFYFNRHPLVLLLPRSLTALVPPLNASPWSSRNPGRNHAFSREHVLGKGSRSIFNGLTGCTSSS